MGLYCKVDFPKVIRGCLIVIHPSVVSCWVMGILLTPVIPLLVMAEWILGRSIAFVAVI